MGWWLRSTYARGKGYLQNVRQGTMGEGESKIDEYWAYVLLNGPIQNGCCCNWWNISAQLLKKLHAVYRWKTQRNARRTKERYVQLRIAKILVSKSVPGMDSCNACHLLRIWLDAGWTDERLLRLLLGARNMIDVLKQMKSLSSNLKTRFIDTDRPWWIRFWAHSLLLWCKPMVRSSLKSSAAAS